MQIDAASHNGRPWLRRLLVPTTFAKPVDLSGKRMIVTGASAGSLGFATAQALAAWGASVVITARKAPKDSADAIRASLPEGCVGQVIAAPLDLSQSDSVTEFVQWYADTQERQLDVLINNAGIHLDLLSQWKSPQLTDDGFERHWRVNYLGTFDLTLGLLPLLLEAARKNGDARVVNVVSQLHAKGRNPGLLVPPAQYNSWVAYGLSKLAVVHMTLELQRRHAQEGLRSSCLHPGAVYSHIADKGLEGAPVLARIRKVLAPLEQAFMSNIHEGAQTTLHCATSPNAVGGEYYRRCQPAKASPESADSAVSRKLWDTTMKWAESVRAT